MSGFDQSELEEIVEMGRDHGLRLAKGHVFNREKPVVSEFLAFVDN
ncbi:MAG: hypothetical protein JNM63_17140 [Spirochaetia bacterium]|nr:hypothetical protein [Spirochaetia bacterium]